MSKSNEAVAELPHVNLRTYTIGFIGSLGFTLFAYLLAVTAFPGRTAAMVAIGVLAIAQCILQLVLFLHVGRETRPRWKLAVFIVMLIMVLIIVIGSLWIMENLDYRMMQSPEQIQDYVKRHDSL